MIELILTCYLAAGASFSVPDGWRVEKIENTGRPASAFFLGGSACIKEGQWVTCPEPERRTHVVMRRKVAAGTRVEMPQGCEKAEVGR